MTRYWLKCKPFEGMFPSEIGVMVSTANGDDFSLFVNKELARPGGPGEVLVSVLSEPNGGELYYLILPDQAFGVSRCISVKSNLNAGEVACDPV